MINIEKYRTKNDKVRKNRKNRKGKDGTEKDSNIQKQIKGQKHDRKRMIKIANKQNILIKIEKIIIKI